MSSAELDMCCGVPNSSEHIGAQPDRHVNRLSLVFAHAIPYVLQTITHMIDDVLSDALLHKQVQPGEIAFMELSRRSGQPVCTGLCP